MNVCVQPSLSFRAEREISFSLNRDFSSRKTLVEMTRERLLRIIPSNSGESAFVLLRFLCYIFSC